MSAADYRKHLLYARLMLDSLEGGIGLSAKEREVEGIRRKIMDMVQSVLPSAITMRENEDFSGPYLEGCVAVVPGDKYRSLLNRLQEIEKSNDRLREELREIRQAEDATSDLIEVLEDLKNHCVHMGFDTREEEPLLAAANAALAKARGKA